jgi:hypothetical protein
LLLGLGAVLGELPNSFVKRQLGIAHGRAPCRASRQTRVCARLHWVPSARSVHDTHRASLSGIDYGVS